MARAVHDLHSTIKAVVEGMAPHPLAWRTGLLLIEDGTLGARMEKIGRLLSK